MRPRIGLVGMAGKNELGFDKTPELIKAAADNLLKSDVIVIDSRTVICDRISMKDAVRIFKDKDLDILCICVGTWSEDHYLLDLLEYIDKPVILWAFPAVDTGSLCGVQQICCVLKELGKRYYYVYGCASDENVSSEILKISRAIALRNVLRHVKIGSVGGRINGMTETVFDELEIKDKTGIRIINIGDGEFLSLYNESDQKEASYLWEKVRSNAGNVTSKNIYGIEAMKYYIALRKMIDRYELEGISVKCYPEFMGKVCLPYSILSQEGIVCGCEGDVNNTVSMKMLFELSSIPVHNTDLLYTEKNLNTILFSHCGSGAFCLASSFADITLGPVRLVDNGICSLFPSKPGIVTLVNLVGRKGTFRLSVMKGEAIECGMEFPGNPLKVRFERDIFEINKKIAEEGTGHHWMAGYGDFISELRMYCDICKIKYIEI